MMVTSDNTSLSAISTEARTGSPTRTNPAMPIELVGSRPPSIRPTPMNTITGKKMDPKAPIGSRKKILISSQVSFQSPRNIIYPSGFISPVEKGDRVVGPLFQLLIANRMAGHLEEDVFQTGEHGTKIGDPDP